MTDLHARDAKRYPVSVLCGLLGASKQAYYKRDENAELAKAAKEDVNLIHHSDRGCQYASSEYVKLLAANCTGELERMWKSYRIAAIKKKTDNSD